jgi:hypothetical protein
MGRGDSHPEELIACHRDHGVTERGRPVFPYSMLACYSGKGHPNEAESFVPYDLPGTKFFLRFAFDAFTLRVYRRLIGSKPPTGRQSSQLAINPRLTISQLRSSTAS